MKYFYLLLIACMMAGCHRIHDGKIIDKIYEPPRTYRYVTYMRVGKVSIPQWHTGYDDEDFIFRVRKVVDSDTITESFYVDKSTYSCMNLGSQFYDSLGCTEDKHP